MHKWELIELNLTYSYFELEFLVKMNNIYIYIYSFQSEGEPSALSSHIRGVVEVGGSKEQNKILKIKAELDCYQHNYSSSNRGGESDLVHRTPSLLLRRSMKRTTSLQTFMDHPEIFIHRASSVRGMKKSRSSSSNRTSKLGQLVEQNARQKTSFF